MSGAVYPPHQVEVRKSSGADLVRGRRPRLPAGNLHTFAAAGPGGPARTRGVRLTGIRRVQAAHMLTGRWRGMATSRMGLAKGRKPGGPPFSVREWGLTPATNQEGRRASG